MTTSPKKPLKSSSESDLIGLLLSFMDTIRGDLTAELPDSCSFMHVKALDFIAGTPEPSMGDVAGFLKITSPGATMVVDKLVENAEIGRHADPNDRRVVRLGITTKGKATLEAGMKIIERKIAKRISSLSKTEEKQLAAIMKKLIRSQK